MCQNLWARHSNFLPFRSFSHACCGRVAAVLAFLLFEWCCWVLQRVEVSGFRVHHRPQSVHCRPNFSELNLPWQHLWVLNCHWAGWVKKKEGCPQHWTRQNTQKKNKSHRWLSLSCLDQKPVAWVSDFFALSHFFVFASKRGWGLVHSREGNVHVTWVTLFPLCLLQQAPTRCSPGEHPHPRLVWNCVGLFSPRKHTVTCGKSDPVFKEPPCQGEQATNPCTRLVTFWNFAGVLLHTNLGNIGYTVASRALQHGLDQSLLSAKKCWEILHAWSTPVSLSMWTVAMFNFKLQLFALVWVWSFLFSCISAFQHLQDSCASQQSKQWLQWGSKFTQKIDTLCSHLCLGIVLNHGFDLKRISSTSKATNEKCFVAKNLPKVTSNAFVTWSVWSMS